MNPHVSVTVQIRAHNQPKPKKGDTFRIAGLTHRYGSKTESIPMSAMLYGMVVEVADFHVQSGAVTETESVAQMRKLIAALHETVNSYEQALATEQKDIDHMNTTETKGQP